MPELLVDLTPLVAREAMFDRMLAGNLPATSRSMQKAAAMLFQRWHASASNMPGLYRKTEYMAGLMQDDAIRQLTPLAIDIVHTNPTVAKQVHEGVAPHDMKPDLTGTLRGESLPSNPGRTGNAREIHDKHGSIVGRYNVIPFRHKGVATPSAVVVSKISPSLTVAGKKTVWGGRLTDTQMRRIASNPGTRRAYETLIKARLARGLKQPSYQDFVNRFRGMVHMKKRYAKATGGMRKTFRAVSVRTDGAGGSRPGSWLHPGWRGVDFPTVVLREMASVVNKLIRRGIQVDFGL